MITRLSLPGKLTGLEGLGPRTVYAVARGIHF